MDRAGVVSLALVMAALVLVDAMAAPAATDSPPKADDKSSVSAESLALLKMTAAHQSPAADGGSNCYWLPPGNLFQLDVVFPSDGKSDPTSKVLSSYEEYPNVEYGEGVERVPMDQVVMYDQPGNSTVAIAKKIVITSPTLEAGAKYNVLRSYWRIMGEKTDMTVKFSEVDIEVFNVYTHVRQTKSGKPCLLPFVTEDGHLSYDCRKGSSVGKVGDVKVAWFESGREKEYCITEGGGGYEECQTVDVCSAHSKVGAFRSRRGRSVRYYY